VPLKPPPPEAVLRRDSSLTNANQQACSSL
jgi:hypothetical protein